VRPSTFRSTADYRLPITVCRSPFAICRLPVPVPVAGYACYTAAPAARPVRRVRT
jgi:hypothetical protein